MEEEWKRSRKERRTLHYMLNQDLVSLFFLFLFRAAPAAYGGSQARGRIGATATAMPDLQPTPQLMSMLDLQPTEHGQGWNLQPHVS